MEVCAAGHWLFSPAACPGERCLSLLGTEGHRPTDMAGGGGLAPWALPQPRVMPCRAMGVIPAMQTPKPTRTLPVPQSDSQRQVDGEGEFIYPAVRCWRGIPVFPYWSQSQGALCVGSMLAPPAPAAGAAQPSVPLRQRGAVPRPSRASACTGGYAQPQP